VDPAGLLCQGIASAQHRFLTTAALTHRAFGDGDEYRPAVHMAREHRAGREVQHQQDHVVRPGRGRR
jgi:hypothetical protein